MKKRLIFVIMFLLFPSVIFADCTAEDRERIQKKANNVTYIIEEEKDYEGDPTGNFVITFSGVSNELTFYDNYAMYHTNYKDYDYGEFYVDRVPMGSKYQVRVGSMTSCLTDNFRIITINLPSYNDYYDDPLCDDVRELSICGKWTKVNMSHEQFVSTIDEYKQKKQTVVPKAEEENSQNLLYELYQKYYWYGLITLIVILGLLIYLWIKEQRKNRL